jgi:urease subunit alpha
MFASYGNALYRTSITFVSKTAFELGIPQQLNLQKMIQPVEHIRSLSKNDMVYNNAMPKIDVDPQTYEVRVDGTFITCEPAEVVPMAQRYFLF